MTKPDRIIRPPRKYKRSDDQDEEKESFYGRWWAGLPGLGNRSIQLILGVTVVLYALNQKALLPLPLSQVVSKVLFWPTLPITVARRLGRWSTVIDDAVVMGGAPFGFCGIPERLYYDYGVRRVINMCDEYEGPLSIYRYLGMDQLRLPTIDHTVPAVEDLEAAVDYIRRSSLAGGRVYVHCRAGHGRSAAAVLAWLLYKDPTADLYELNQKLCRIRDVKSTLWRQPNMLEFQHRLLKRECRWDTDPI